MSCEGAIDHSILSLTPLRYLVISAEQTAALRSGVQGFAMALHTQALVNAAIQREWLLSLGQRKADERMAHLLAELYVRLQSVGLTEAGSCEFPLVQSDIAAATGLSAVHVNRTLQQLRREGLIELSNKRLTILNLDRLREIALFEPHYLHLDAA